ncbi:MAG: N-acetylmannosamine-6-phosphate 2-epimerase [Lachnospiraceae bacterium]|nr:N-acetylmannosamine-6-phosphate 2-epimerase [Lachnospiraceae bacterium]
MNILDNIKGGLIVSCQALPDEPLHSSYIMAKMAYAAMMGGAKGIRANTAVDINEIKKVAALPVIGIVKCDYNDSPIYITPTMQEVDELTGCGAEIIAMDATARLRPGGEGLKAFFTRVREKYPRQLFMADCATFAEGIAAAEMGFDIISTTLCGYTDESKGMVVPDYSLLTDLVSQCGKPVIAEGGIWAPAELRQAMACGCHAAVVGSAITRPQLITERFVRELG